MLRLSIDEREEGDREASVRDLAFVANEELAVQYGERFSITLDNDMPVVKSDNCVSGAPQMGRCGGN